MITLSEIISQPISVVVKAHHKPNFEVLSRHIPARSEKPQDVYEAGVFNFLFDNRQPLEIKNVMKFTALLVDGAVELLDGRHLTVEVKFRMNWEKACQAEYQFRTFLTRKDRMPFAVHGGLIVFDEFSGDWKRNTTSRVRENGWDN